MITIRNYASKHGCTVQNIYKHIKANKEHLEGHVIKQGSKQFLDEFAQEFLDQFITPKETVQIADEVLMKEINKLRAQLVMENQKVSDLAMKNMELGEQIAHMQANQMLLENKSNQLEAAAEREHALRAEKELELEQTKTELGKFKKTFFGLYKKTN